MANASQTLDLKLGREAAINHQTKVKVLTGATVISVLNPASNDIVSVLLESMTEPTEQMVSQSSVVHVLHLQHPLEWVAGAYAGGQASIVMWEGWDQTPYQQAGFADSTEFLDVINHVPFRITVMTYKPSNYGGGVSKMELQGCRLLAPIVPQGTISRQTTTRKITAQFGYTRLIRTGFGGTP